VSLLLVLCAWVAVAGLTLLLVIGACRAGHREDVARGLLADAASGPGHRSVRTTGGVSRRLSGV
jgi:hypothetical protein